jgi:hypothetical protein
VKRAGEEEARAPRRYGDREYVEVAEPGARRLPGVAAVLAHPDAAPLGAGVEPRLVQRVDSEGADVSTVRPGRRPRHLLRSSTIGDGGKLQHGENGENGKQRTSRPHLGWSSWAYGML